MFDSTASVILAAGRGTRMKSAQAKVAFEILGQPLIQYPVLLGENLGVGQTIVVVGHDRDEVESCVNAVSDRVVFALQSDPNGTAGAVLAAKEACKDAEQVLILSGDVPGLSQDTVLEMANAFEREQTPLVVLCFDADDPTGYGRIIETDSGHMDAIVEERDATDDQKSLICCNAGIYLVNRRFLYDAIATLSTDNAQNEFYLTDIVAHAKAVGTPAFAVYCEDEGEVAGVNSRVDLAQANKRLQAIRNDELMMAGVSILDSESVWVEWPAQIAPDVTLHPGVVIRGKSTIGEGSSIGNGSILQDAKIGQGVEVRPYCVITLSELGNNTTVGPFAHLRPGTHLAEDAKIGNFVETKKTNLGRGSKANHLTYLGDSDIGAGVNIGAGTITCNYDGVDKHRTIIRDRVFIGSNVELVAPVTLGEESVVGAGTTVTRDVPPRSLALSRAPQATIEGWADDKGPVARRKARSKKE